MLEVPRIARNRALRATGHGVGGLGVGDFEYFPRWMCQFGVGECNRNTYILTLFDR